MKLSHTVSNFDGSNAFASTEREPLRQLHSKRQYEHNVERSVQAVGKLAVHAKGIDGDINMKPSRGTTMGHAMAAGDFLRYTRLKLMNGISSYKS